MMMKGQKINDRYQIIKTIGEGGMANVYLAYDTILDRNVAIKVLRGDLAADDKFVRRFQREALAASSLNHPNIVEVYDVGEDNGQYYIVMEYIEGKHLKQLLKKRGQLTVHEVIDIMLQITDGIACAHDSYIIHRDIKPQNIMILENGLIKITDFGIAMALNSTQLTQTNSVMGSVHYLPPEQASGKGSTLKSDIYSMGILMYELLTGKLPYKGDNAVEIALKHLKEPMPSIRDELPNIAQSVENVILKAAAKNPKNRYNDAREMNEDLKTVLNENRLNEPKYEYKYPENDIDDTKLIKAIENQKVDEDTPIAKQITEGDLKKQNKTLIILASIFTGLVVLVAAIVLFLPLITNPKEIAIPDVVGKTPVEAEETLKDKGFSINTDYKEISSDDVTEGNVVKTSPGTGSKRTKGTEITLYISSGSGAFIMEDYTGRKYYEVQAELKVHDVNVIIQKKDVENPKDYDASEILSQTPAKGEKVDAGDTVTLYIPNIVTELPDFTTGDYSVSEIQAYANEHEMDLTIEYEESTLAEGTIISQSKPKGYTVIKGGKLTIKVATKQEKEETNNNGELLE